MAKWIRFNENPPAPGRVTKTWEVCAVQGGAVLGTIRWYPGWRKYVFAPLHRTEYEQDCLRDIAAFIEEQTRAHKASRTGGA